jgi:hypothetical protein
MTAGNLTVNSFGLIAIAGGWVFKTLSRSPLQQTLMEHDVIVLKADDAQGCGRCACDMF